MALFEFKGYDNSVLQEQIESIISTKLDLNRFMTADYSLELAPGMVVKIHKYTGTGEVEDLARGEGNSKYIDAEYSEVEYRVGRTQGHARWYDDDQMTDPTLVDAKIKYLSEGMVNDWTDKAIKEFDKTENQIAITDYSLGSFADIIAQYTNKYEDQAGLFFLVNIKDVPALRKMLGDYLKYTEAYIRTGAIGDILGVPVYTSKALPEGIVFCATKDAVTAYIKKGVRVEQDRDIDTKLNDVVADRYTVIALTDESKCIKAGKAQETSLTATADVSEGTIAGAAEDGAKVVAYDADGAELGHTTAVSGAYSISSDEFAAGDKVKVVAKVDGFLPEILVVEAQA